MSYLLENETKLINEDILKRKEFYQIDLDVLKELIKSCDKMSLTVRKINKNIRQEGEFFIMLDKNE